MRKQILKLVSGALTGIIIFGLSAVAAGAFDFESFESVTGSADLVTSQGVSAYAEDTLAGFPTSVASSVVGANSRVVFESSDVVQPC